VLLDRVALRLEVLRVVAIKSRLKVHIRGVCACHAFSCSLRCPSRMIIWVSSWILQTRIALVRIQVMQQLPAFMALLTLLR